ncbi:hypothetical protein STEG23_016070 [Scotinomys teguina]
MAYALLSGTVSPLDDMWCDIHTVEENPAIQGASGKGSDDVDANSYDNDSDDGGEDIDYAAADNCNNVNNGDGHSSVDGDGVD